MGCLLPGDQLIGGQLTDLFDVVQKVANADTVSDTAREYLRFRNLLPFATVDAGSRGGHAERRDANVDQTFDKGSLMAAALLQETELTGTGNPDAAIRALEETGSILSTQIGLKRWSEQICEWASQSCLRLTPGQDQPGPSPIRASPGMVNSTPETS